MNREEFEAMVLDVIHDLPEEFASRLDNVEFFVEEYPNQEQLRKGHVPQGMTLFGLYEGIPRTKRGSNYAAVLPDRITLFAGPILTSSGYEKERVQRQIRSTVLHELGHYFGMTEEEIRKAQHLTH
jgi:predicted Zn-dependent protease with MMP-like domain